MDNFELYPTGEAWIEGTVKACVSLKDRSELTSFFDELLNGKLTDKELEKLFFRFNHALRISDDGIRIFLTKIRDALR